MRRCGSPGGQQQRRSGPRYKRRCSGSLDSIRVRSQLASVLRICASPRSHLPTKYTEWEGLDAWLESERVLGATLGRQVMDAAQPGDTVERRLKVLDPLMSWAHAFSQNLRLFRNSGYDRQTLSKLQMHAADLTRSISERHGWESPRTSNPRLSTLD